MQDDSFFRDFVVARLGADAFAPDFDNADEQIFAASLASFESLIAGVNVGGFPLAVGYVDTMTPNAFAAFHKGRQVVGMNQALLVTIVEFNLYAFTQREVFPLIGDAGGEDSPPPLSGEAPGLLLLDRTLAAGVIDDTTDRHRVPKDAERHIAAIYLAMLMTRFVWLHELAHCQLGHVVQLRQRGDLAALHEVPDSAALVGFRPPDPAAMAARRTMELEADAMALRQCWDIQLSGYENLPGVQAMPEAQRLEMVLLGAYLMTWLFDEYQRHMETRRTVTHPAPRDRLAALLTVAADELHGTIAGFDQLHDRVTGHFNAVAERIAAMPPLPHRTPRTAS